MILKPSTMSEARGIELHNKPNLILRSKANLAQRYIMNPLLIHNKKFDLRILFAVTSLNPLNMYIYSEGGVRKCSHEYTNDLSQLDNHFIHLTNYNIQDKSGKDSPKNVTDVDNDLSTIYSSYEAFKRSIPKDKADSIWKQMKDIGVKTILSMEDFGNKKSMEDKISPNKGFSLLGFDFLIDEDYKVWLLEVNRSPSLSYTVP